MSGDNVTIFKVKRDANVRKNATALSSMLREGKTVEMECVGAEAVNQAFKICVQTRADISRTGKDLLIRPGMFNKLDDKGKDFTIMKLTFVLQ